MCKGNIFQGGESSGGESAIVDRTIPDDTDDDSSTSIVPYFVRSFNVFQVACAVNRERYGDFRRGNHIDRGFPGFEYFEYFPNKTVSKQHVAGFDFYGRDSVLAATALKSFDGTFRDQSSLRRLGSSCFHAHGNVLLSRVECLTGGEFWPRNSKFGSFIKR